VLGPGDAPAQTQAPGQGPLHVRHRDRGAYAALQEGRGQHRGRVHPQQRHQRQDPGLDPVTQYLIVKYRKQSHQNTTNQKHGPEVALVSGFNGQNVKK